MHTFVENNSIFILLIFYKCTLKNGQKIDRVTGLYSSLSKFSGGLNFASIVWHLIIQESQIKIQDPYFPMDYFSNLNKLSIEDYDLIYMIFFYSNPFSLKCSLIFGINIANFTLLKGGGRQKI